MRKNNCNRILVFLFALLMLCLPYMEVSAATTMNLYNNSTKKNVKYTGKQVKYNFNGSTINMNKAPGIIVNGTALASYQEVFVKDSLKLKSKYSKTKKTLTLSKDKTTIVFTVGSKKAKVNGKVVTLSVAPINMKYKDQGVSKILVPTRFVTETFGYEYSWNNSAATATIIPPRNLYYNGKKVAYNGADGQVTVDGKKLNLGTMESIIIDSTAMVLAKKVFSDSSIGAEYVYNKADKIITLTKGSDVVELTLGDTTAYVNGNARDMDSAPMIVRNLDTKKSYIMVPGSFVSSYLGYDYNWNSSTKTSVITTRPPETNTGSNSGNNGNDVELGSNPAPELDTITMRWDMLSNYIDNYNSVNSIVKVTEINNTASDIAYVNSVNLESNDLTKEVYAIRSNVPFHNSSINLDNNTLTVLLNNASTNTGDLRFGGNIVDYISMTNDSANVTSKIAFGLKNSNFKYECMLSDDKCTLYVIFYPNYITDISVGTKAGNDYFMINSMEKLQVDLVDYGSYLMLQLQNTVNTTGDNYCDTSSLNYIKSVQSVGIGNNSMNIIINKSADATYSVSQQGDSYMIGFPSAESTIGGNTSLSKELQIKLPDGMSFYSVRHEDRYYNKEIAIILPGDYRDFYNNNPIAVSTGLVKNVSVTNNGVGETEIIISTYNIQGYKLVDNNGSIQLVMGNPKEFYKNIVVLDPGHGGTAPGAVRTLDGVTYYEKDINYSILYEKANKYFNACDSKVKVYYTRIDDSDVSLDERSAFADQVGADIFVSLHMNANNKTSIQGTDVYYSSMNDDMAPNGLSSKKLASMLLNYIPDYIGTDTRYILNSKLAVCKNNTVPAVLVELLFMSNPDELAMAIDDDFQETAAKTLYDAVCSVFDSYPTGR